MGPVRPSHVYKMQHVSQLPSSRRADLRNYGSSSLRCDSLPFSLNALLLTFLLLSLSPLTPLLQDPLSFCKLTPSFMILWAERSGFPEELVCHIHTYWVDAFYGVSAALWEERSWEIGSDGLLFVMSHGSRWLTWPCSQNTARHRCLVLLLFGGNRNWSQRGPENLMYTSSFLRRVISTPDKAGRLVFSIDLVFPLSMIPYKPFHSLSYNSRPIWFPMNSRSSTASLEEVGSSFVPVVPGISARFSHFLP